MYDERKVALYKVIDSKTSPPYNLIKAYDGLISLSIEENKGVCTDECKANIDTCINLCVKFLKNVRNTTAKINITRRVEITETLSRMYTLKAPYDFESYCLAMEWNREPKKRFYMPRMGILSNVAHKLTDLVLTDKYDMVFLSMPPGTGKSTLGLFFLSWVAGIKPESPNLVTGHSDKITKSFYDEMLSLTTDSEYRYKEIFPEIELTTTSAKDESLDYRNDGKATKRRYPTVTCRSIDGSLTGATRCETILYCDDLVANIEEAKNISRMDSLFDKYMSDLRSRKKKGCKELHIGTRWSIHDVIGRLEQIYEGDERKVFINLPALDEKTDESNFDYKYNVGFSTENYHDMRKQYQFRDDMVTWECLYQQNPMERDGILFEESSLKRFYSLPNQEPDEVFAFCDVAFGGNDYLCLVIGYRYGEDIYVPEVVFMKGDYHRTQPLVANALEGYQVQNVIFEANNGGDFYARDVADMLKERQCKCSVRSERAKSNISKAGRIDQYAPDIRNFYFLDSSRYDPRNFYRNFITNLTTYTAVGKNKNDDAPDACAGLASMIRIDSSVKVATIDRRRLGF